MAPLQCTPGERHRWGCPGASGGARREGGEPWTPAEAALRGGAGLVCSESSSRPRGASPAMEEITIARGRRGVRPVRRARTFDPPARRSARGLSRETCIQDPGPVRGPFVSGASLMPATVIVGLQWGDEGKGKTTDFLAEHVAMVVRYQGGDNAGHTVVVGDETLKLQLCPSGVLYPHITSVIGNGVVVNPQTLIAELDMLMREGHRRLAGAGQPQRARDHAVPRGPRPGQRGPPRRREGRARPAAGSGPRTATAPGASGSGWRTCATARCCATGSGARCPTRTCCSTPWARPVRPSKPLVEQARGLGRAPGAAPRRHDVARPGRAEARRPRAARGRPGNPARPRPRQLPVRHLVEPGRRRRLHRRRHRPAAGRRGHRRDEGLLDAGRARVRSRRSCSTTSARASRSAAASSAP